MEDEDILTAPFAFVLNAQDHRIPILAPVVKVGDTELLREVEVAEAHKLDTNWALRDPPEGAKGVASLAAVGENAVMVKLDVIIHYMMHKYNDAHAAVGVPYLVLEQGDRGGLP